MQLCFVCFVCSICCMLSAMMLPHIDLPLKQAPHCRYNAVSPQLVDAPESDAALAGMSDGGSTRWCHLLQRPGRGTPAFLRLQEGCRDPFVACFSVRLLQMPCLWKLRYRWLALLLIASLVMTLRHWLPRPFHATDCRYTTTDCQGRQTAT